jgi:uncharacterized protein YxjI
LKLFIKQSVLSWSDKFTVKDESGEDRWIVQGDALSFAHLLRVYDLSGKERATIKEKWSFFRKHVVQAGFESFEIIKEFSMFSQRYDIIGIGWSVAGDFLAHDYTIEGEDQVIAHMTKEWLTWGDSYRLDIISQRDELPALCIALAIDCSNRD